ncbi:hypothetical protein C8F01DRAFT_1232050 [Mycena amicta]|nr:hypothetical protein C8F01DRAFT_1232050 [Mycena amicta]
MSFSESVAASPSQPPASTCTTTSAFALANANCQTSTAPLFYVYTAVAGISLLLLCVTALVARGIFIRRRIARMGSGWQSVANEIMLVQLPRPGEGPRPRMFDIHLKGTADANYNSMKLISLMDLSPARIDHPFNERRPSPPCDTSTQPRQHLRFRWRAHTFIPSPASPTLKLPQERTMELFAAVLVSMPTLHQGSITSGIQGLEMGTFHAQLAVSSILDWDTA